MSITLTARRRIVHKSSSETLSLSKLYSRITKKLTRVHVYLGPGFSLTRAEPRADGVETESAMKIMELKHNLVRRG